MYERCVKKLSFESCNVASVPVCKKFEAYWSPENWGESKKTDWEGGGDYVDPLLSTHFHATRLCSFRGSLLRKSSLCKLGHTLGFDLET